MASSPASTSSMTAAPVAPPRPGTVPPGYKFITEGSASILYEANEEAGDKGEPVFYNKVQVLNRDLSIRMITQFVRTRAREKATPKGNRAKRRAAAQAAEADAVAGAAAVAGTVSGEAPAASSEGSNGAATAAAAGADSESAAASTSGASAAAGANVLNLSSAELDAKLRAEAPERGIRILDALAATGLRSIRYFKEIPGVKQVVTNDLDPAAVVAAKQNVAFNGCTLDQVSPRQGDACAAMFTPEGGGKYDVIDLDPYGSAAPFLDAAVQSVADGGLLCITCTDMAVLSGNQPDACFAKYGSMPTKARYLHEMALRILLHSLSTSAARYRRYIVPTISCGIDFYIRVFVRVHESAAEVKNTCLKTGYVFQSVRCPSFHLQPVATLKGHSYHGNVLPVGLLDKCHETNGGLRMGGPIWLNPIHDLTAVQEVLDDVTAYKEAQAQCPKDQPLLFPPIATRDRLHGLLTSVTEELNDVPLYYTLPDLCQTLHCTSPKMDDFKSALINAGYRCSAFHKEPAAVKTDAPNEVVWDIMRCWVQKHPLNKKRVDAEKSPGTTILDTPPTIQANFARPKGGLAAKPKAQRYPHNPEEHWGPKARARTIKSAPPAAAAAAGDGGSAGTEANNGNGSAEAEKIEEANGEEPVAKQARRE